MNELQILQRVGTELPEISDEVRERGRTQLLATAGVDPSTQPSHNRFGGRIGRWTAGGRSAVRRSVPRRTPMRLVAGLAAAAIVAVGIQVAQVATPEGRGTPSAAAQLLDRAATATIGAQDPVVGPSQYLKVTTLGTYLATVMDIESDGTGLSYLEAEKREVWIPGDPRAEWVMRVGPRTPYLFFAPGDKEKLTGAEDPGTGHFQRAVDGKFFGPDTDPAGWQNPDREFLAGLPRDPAVLLDRIHQDSGWDCATGDCLGQGPSRDAEALTYAADVLRSGVVPGDLRAALFRAVGLVPGVEVVDERANFEGRTGVAVGRVEPSNGLRQEIIFDPDTGQVIGERDVTTRAGDDGIPVGAVVSLTSVRSEVVDSAPTGPNG